MFPYAQHPLYNNNNNNNNNKRTRCLSINNLDSFSLGNIFRVAGWLKKSYCQFFTIIGFFLKKWLQYSWTSLRKGWTWGKASWSPIANFNPLSANPTKWSNTLKQFVGKLPTNCLSVFDHFVKLALKGLIKHWIQPWWKCETCKIYILMSKVMNFFCEDS